MDLSFSSQLLYWPHFGLFLGLILATVLFNTVVFIIVLRVLVKYYLRKIDDIDAKKQLSTSFKTLTSVVSIMFMFGLQWLFGAFTIAQASVVFQWFFVILSTLQGVFLFLYFCVLAQDSREEWLNLLSMGRHRKVKRRSVGVSSSSHSGQTRYSEQKCSSSSVTTSPDYSSATLKRNVLLATASSSSLSKGSAAEMASRRSVLFALPDPITEVKETEFVITNGNVSDHDDGKSDTSEEIENVDLSLEATTIANPATAVEVPPHIIERRFGFHQSPPPTKEVEKVDLSIAPPKRPRRTARTREPTVEVPPHVLERRRSSASFSSLTSQKPAENKLSALEEAVESKEQDDYGEEWDFDDTHFFDANDYDFGDDFTQLLNLSNITDEDCSDFDEMTSNL